MAQIRLLANGQYVLEQSPETDTKYVSTRLPKDMYLVLKMWAAKEDIPLYTLLSDILCGAAECAIIPKLSNLEKE